ncbi:hypothetical protein DUI87_02982 [Hirundo rustica rustica]|uniref:RNA-directed DNA polymerase n=1 Tax=Hirundo rustica rustica TaxID=333673 RepID=A0A3M0L9D7_HIRRU|nr:hypothetical protein DUI87_02982 [Hirundo rustica rustica]
MHHLQVISSHLGFSSTSHAHCCPLSLMKQLAQDVPLMSLPSPESSFPLDITAVKKDHSFLDQDSLKSLCRRLMTLNICFSVKLDVHFQHKQNEDSEEKDLCAISNQWAFQRDSKRWSWVGSANILSQDSEALSCTMYPVSSCKSILMDLSTNLEATSLHRTGSVGSIGGMGGTLGTAVMPSEPPSPLYAIANASSCSQSEGSAPEQPPSQGEDSKEKLKKRQSRSFLKWNESLRRKDKEKPSPDSRVAPHSSTTLPPGGTRTNSSKRRIPASFHSKKHFLVSYRTNRLLGPRGTKGSSDPECSGVYLEDYDTATATVDAWAAAECQRQAHHGDCLVYIPCDYKPGTFPKSLSIESFSLGSHVSVYDNVPKFGSSEDFCKDREVIHENLDDILQHVWGLQQKVELWCKAVSPGLDQEEEGEEEEEDSGGEPSNLHFEEQSMSDVGTSASDFDSTGNSLNEAEEMETREHWDSGVGASLTRPCRTVLKFMKRSKVPDYRDKMVFGVPPMVNVQRTGQPLPQSIQQAMRYLRSQCLDQVGIFCKSGVKSRIQALRHMNETSPDNVNYLGQSAYDVADLLKQYFRDLPEPIFTNRLTPSCRSTSEQRLQAVQAAIILMPDENREVLQTLLYFLSDIVSAEENQMTAGNLAVCLAPSIFHLNVSKKENTSPRAIHKRGTMGKLDQKDLNENMAATQGLSHMITDCKKLFQVGDGHPLRLWKVSTDVEAPPAMMRHRVLRERHLWDEDLLQSRVVEALDKDMEVYHYVTDSMAPHPHRDYMVLRGQSPEWYNRVFGHLCAMELEDKVQRMPPWKYLGLQIAARTIVPQKMEIECNPKTLADLHSLCGSLNWVRPWLGLTNEDLDPLFNLLKGERELVSPRELTPEAKTAIEKVQKALSERQAHRCEPNIPFQFIVLGKLPHLHGLIFQWIEGQRDSLLIIEWVFLSHQRSKTITEPQELIAQLIQKARVRLCELAGCDFTCIHLPVKLSKEGRNSPKRLTKEMFEHLLQSNASLQLSLDSYRGQISVHAPSHKLLNEEFHLIPREKRSRRPLKALTVFTDASGASHKSVMTWRNPQTQRWEADVEFVEGSPQVAELAAVVRAFEKFSEPINLVTDSAYVVGVVSRAEQAVLKEIDNEHLFRLLSKLIYLISHREHPFYVMHVRSHTDLPGEVAEGNRQADSLAAPVEKARLPDIFQQAKLSHQQYHQNVPGLIRQFQLTRSQARAIVATCPNCQVQAMPSMGMGVNPRGLGSCEVWQTDITHIPSFGHLKYVHVSIDTHSGAVYASAHAGEKTEHAKKHLVQAFSVLGIPKEINTDNSPAYTFKGFLEFLQQWGVEHKTGIPHSPTGQAVVERAHQTLKQVLARQSSTTVGMSPHEKLCKAMFTVNFLNCSFENMSPPVVRHFNSGNQFKLSQRPPVMIRDPETWETKGPYELVTWGRGYACVATPSGPRWIPQKWVKPFVPKNPAPAEGDKRQVAIASKRRCRRMEEKESS